MDRSAAHTTGRARRLADSLAAAAAPFWLGGPDDPPLAQCLQQPVEHLMRAAPSDGPAAASALGSALVRAGCIEPGVLEAILPLIGDALGENGVAEAAVYTSLGALAYSYAAALRERTLHHQEQLYQALRHSRDTARAELLEESRFVNAILDHMEALVVVATVEGQITRFNAAAERISGYTVEELNRGEGRPLVTDETFPAVQEAVDILVRGGGSPRAVPVRSQWLSRDGQTHDVAWILSLIYDESGNFTHYVGTGIDITAQLRVEEELREARQKLAEREGTLRQRLARALHDGSVQELLSLGVTVADMQARAEADETWTARERLEEVIPGLEMVRRELLAVATGLRQLMAELRPPGLEEMGLRQALEAYLQNEGLRQPPLQVSLSVSGAVDDLDERVRTTLFYVAREALRNVQRHSGATAAAVIVRCDGAVASITVRDNGRGFTVPDRLASLVRRHQFGLIGIQERVKLQGGEVTIESAPGSGTAVHVTLPVA
ncbi:MAG: PAS domain-containing sensor histidine kinase [Anaerolineae bacterium]|nr:PAS domain-containing sensor histidine kinase [Anaerolineae bacterium]